MASDNENREIVDVVDVVRHDSQKILLPDGIPLDRVIQRLVRQMEYENELTVVNSVFSCLPPEGAVALHRVLEREFGFVQTKKFSQGTVREVKIGVNETVSVNWGRFEVPSLDDSEFLATDSTTDSEGRVVFAISGRIRRKNENIFKELVAKVREEIRTNSIYKERAWRIRLNDDGGYPLEMPEPEFIELNPNVGSLLTFSDEVLASLRLNLWGFIENTQKFRDRGISLKRGVIMSGGYGTGKSMTATETANIAVRNGWTYIVCDRASELAAVARLAREYGPCIVFCEDVDRVVNGERNISMDELLNVIDGIESKAAELILVFTTNDLDSIHEAMLRPGRIDGVIRLQFPDAKATEVMIRKYAGNSLPANVDISRAVSVIAGNRTSGVAEVANRAISAAILNGNKKHLTAEDVYEAALSVKNQLDGLARDKAERELSDIERAANIVMDRIPTLLTGRIPVKSSGMTNGHAKDETIPLQQG